MKFKYLDQTAACGAGLPFVRKHARRDAFASPRHVRLPWRTVTLPSIRRESLIPEK